MKKLIFTMAMIAAQSSLATTVSIWEGPGSLFDLKGNPTGTYNLIVENIKEGKQTQSNVTILLPDGTVRKQQCLNTETSEGKRSSKSSSSSDSSKSSSNNPFCEITH